MLRPISWPTWSLCEEENYLPTPRITNEFWFLGCGCGTATSAHLCMVWALDFLAAFSVRRTPLLRNSGAGFPSGLFAAMKGPFAKKFRGSVWGDEGLR